MAFAMLDQRGVVLFEGVLISSGHDGVATTTPHPVEEGIATTDHVQPQNETGRFTVGISDTGLAGPRPGLTANTYEFLDQLRRNPVRVDVLTRTRTLRSVVLVGLSQQYTDQSGTGLLVDLRFEEVRVTSTAFEGVPANILARVRRSGGKGKGRTQQATRGETAREQRARGKTILKGIADAGRALLR